MIIIQDVWPNPNILLHFSSSSIPINHLYWYVLTRWKKLIQSTYRSWTYLNERPATCNCPRCLYSAKAIIKLYLFVVLASFLLLGFSQARKYLKVITCNKIDPMKTCLYSIIIVLAFFLLELLCPRSYCVSFLLLLSICMMCPREKKNSAWTCLIITETSYHTFGFDSIHLP